MKISDIFRIKRRFLRSAHLERDFTDPSALKDYVLTPHIKENLVRIVSGLAPQSNQRAWRVTGDYGSGKSSFALALTHILSGDIKSLPESQQDSFKFLKTEGLTHKLVPVLITGSREPLTLSILRSLHVVLTNTLGRGRIPNVVGKIQNYLSTETSPVVPDDVVLEIISEANLYLTASAKGTGLLIVLDELGKFLEFAALYPDRQDVYFLQKLAETASRSGAQPLFVVGLLHQGFNSYADQLSQTAQKEWEKIAGRYEELVFNQPLEQTASLVASALNIHVDNIPADIKICAEGYMTSTLQAGWYGAACNKTILLENAKGLYPLHPTVLPVLARVFSRFGQNERSLFSFLFSNEPFGLQEFSDRSVSTGDFYRLHDLYDYVRTVFGHRLSVQSYSSHWNLIDSVIQTFPASNEIELKILKTVGLLNILDSNNLLATENIITLAIAPEGSNASEIISVIKTLREEKRVLYFRGIFGGYSLWPYTSVNLEAAYKEASRAVGTNVRVSSIIHEYLESRPLVARRHYIETGNMRHFEVRYVPVSQIDGEIEFNAQINDGLIIIPLCESPQERHEALRFVQQEKSKSTPEILIAIPKPLGSLSTLVQEVLCWEWIVKNIPDLNHDSYAMEEVSRQITSARKVLLQRIQAFIGIKQFSGQDELQWFSEGKQVEIGNGREILSSLSDLCDNIFSKAPKLRNELVNRRAISAAASSARMRLIERIFKYSTEPFLGMDDSKKPPEMSMYLSVLKAANLHQVMDDGYSIAVPDEQFDDCNVRPAMERIRQIVEGQPDSRIKISDIYEALRKKPFGVRDGIIPLLVAVFSKMHEQDVAYYENGTFMREVGGEDFPRIVKAPDTFEIQYCKISGVRSDLFNKLMNILGLNKTGKRDTELLDVVRPLCRFAAKLPVYSHKTKRLSPHATAVRSALLSAREPVVLIFHDLPKACGFKPFSADKQASEKEIVGFVDSLKEAIDEVKAAFPELQERMKKEIQHAFGVPGTFQVARNQLADISEKILLTVKELRVKAFCMRLIDNNLPESEWLESLGSFICSKPPSKWIDTDEELFIHEMQQLVGKFKRLESMAFASSPKESDSTAIRISITKSDGCEIDQVLYLTREDESKVAGIEEQLSEILNETSNIGLTAASRVIWKLLNK